MRKRVFLACAEGVETDIRSWPPQKGHRRLAIIIRRHADWEVESDLNTGDWKDLPFVAPGNRFGSGAGTNSLELGLGCLSLGSAPRCFDLLSI